MGLSLRKAADEAKVSKSTVLRAIQSGRLSATRTDDGGWSVDPAELFRVYPPGTARIDSSGQDAPASVTAGTPDPQVAALREIIARLDGQVADLRQDRDHWRLQAEQATRLITDARERDARPWWRRLVG
jgi:hypothetical protein